MIALSKSHEVPVTPFLKLVFVYHWEQILETLIIFSVQHLKREKKKKNTNTTKQTKGVNISQDACISVQTPRCPRCYAILHHHSTFFTTLLEDKEKKNKSQLASTKVLLAAVKILQSRKCNSRNQDVSISTGMELFQHDFTEKEGRFSCRSWGGAWNL